MVPVLAALLRAAGFFAGLGSMRCAWRGLVDSLRPACGMVGRVHEGQLLGVSANHPGGHKPVSTTDR